MKTSATSSRTVSQDQISQRARDLWLARGSPEGQDLAIWLEAERQLASSDSSAKEPTKSARKGRTAISEKTLRDSEVIDAGELQERLREFGEPPRRSPTSLDLT